MGRGVACVSDDCGAVISSKFSVMSDDVGVQNKRNVRLSMA